MNEKKQLDSLTTDYFDQVYAAQDDPWNFEKSEYEKDKYAATINSLTRENYGSAFEIGCSIGVLTEQLAARCHKLLAIDVSQKALDKAISRCAGFNHVEFKLMSIPQEFPVESFDLIIVSEVAYYLNEADWQKATELLLSHLNPNGNIILVHWTHPVHDYPLTGDVVHDLFAEWNRGKLNRITESKTDDYRLDVWQKP